VGGVLWRAIVELGGLLAPRVVFIWRSGWSIRMSRIGVGIDTLRHTYGPILLRTFLSGVISHSRY